MIFQGTKLISHRAWTWTSDPTLQLQIVITSQEYTLPPLPVSVLHSPTSISWQHILKHLLYLNKALMLKFFVQDLPLEESKLKHSSALCFLLLSISFISDPKKNIQGMVSMWHFQDSSSVSEKSAYTFSSLCGVDIFCGYQVHLMAFIWRTWAWKDLIFYMTFLWGIFVYYKKVLFIPWPQLLKEKRPSILE